ncbi:hypothetical protein PSH28_05015 [Pseudomonas resinovorans]|uniref:hypothetical protein n=1 Tax=Metapseudomonas resinovorans TaxID=53412 RepID=UPI00237F9081|nr:hypothetical protein [Pseudomonas resinovorans]MDE3735945.1 hypothetical protein [Pseudomonas resinovorans]
MLIDMLRVRIEASSPGDKFVLIRFIQLHGVDKPVALSVQALAKDVGVTNRVASTAIQRLVAQGVLVRQTIGAQLGRPSSSYTCVSEVLAEYLESGREVTQESIHEQCIVRLLDGVLSRASDRLFYANRLLLAVLLAHADEFGVVGGLGLRDLSELTGLKKDVLKSRIQLLTEKGFIRVCVSGATASGLFRPMKSRYYLNLAHPFFARFHEGGVLVHATLVLTRQNEMSEVERVYAFASALKEGRGLDDSFDLVQFPYLQHAKRLVDWLSDPRARRFISTLQSKLDGCAAAMLSRRWSEIPDRVLIHDKGLIRRICREFRLRSGLTGLADRPKRRALIFLLLEAAHHRAMAIHSALVADFSGIPFNSLDFCILPNPKRNLMRVGFKPGQIPITVVLLAKSRRPSLFSGCHVATRDQRMGRAVECFENEAELPLKSRWLYGLSQPEELIESDKAQIDTFE